VIALIHHPLVLKKAQSQIDAVLGMPSSKLGTGVRDLRRLPTLEDRDQLPYITAIALESLRWRDIAPIGELLILSILAIVSRGS
jgi:cytochrome P450